MQCPTASLFLGDVTTGLVDEGGAACCDGCGVAVGATVGVELLGASLLVARGSDAVGPPFVGDDVITVTDVPDWPGVDSL